jgi:hypothetical protein
LAAKRCSPAILFELREKNVRAMDALELSIERIAFDADERRCGLHLARAPA